MEFIKKAVKVGNSAGVLLPKKLLGSEVRVIVLSRPIDIRKIVFKNISPFLPDVLGIYTLHKNPLEVLVITHSTKKIIESSSFKISLVPLTIVKRDIKSNPSLREKISQAEPILNKSLILQLKEDKS